MNARSEMRHSDAGNVTGYTTENKTAADGHSTTALLLLVLVAVLLTRFSWAPSYQWTDNVNLAYAIESFDPAQHHG